MSIRSRKLFGFTSVVLAMFVLAACSNSDGGGSGESRVPAVAHARPPTRP